VPNFLVGDPLRLNQILINLGNNAVKFTEQGEIVLTTRVVEKSEGKITLQFSMRDTGLGMTEQQQAKLFQAFSQVDTSTTRKYGGTGLGLTISKRLVNMMGGDDIGVESKPGQGTTFSFTAEFGLGKETLTTRFVPSSDLRGLKVLVVDDNAMSRNILQDIMKSFSFEVDLAASGEDAVEAIERADQDQPFELVIMDWEMPGIDGIEASLRIKTHKALKKIPAIIMLTGYGRDQIMHKADEIGLEGFLQKPVSSSTLFDTVMLALGKKVQDQSGISREKEMATEGLQALNGARVLLVEDNEINQQVAQEILQGAGLNITLANNGQEGVDAARLNQYDAILMDIQMPVMDGYEATRAIRKWESVSANADSDVWETEVRGQKTEDRSQASNLQPPTSNIPIIAMTAHAMAGDEQKSIAAGMNDHVTKPIDPDQLFAALQKWIRPIEDRIDDQSSTVSKANAAAQTVNLDENELPKSLPGFDLAAGLERLRGNKHLYRKLLLDFGANYTGVAAEIREALAANDFDQAHSLVHDLKGLAGNLEATSLQAAAVELEKLVRGKTAKTAPDKDLNRKFVELENAVEHAIYAVQTLGPTADKKTIASNKEAIASVPPELIQKVTESIKTAVELGDVMKIKSIAEELKSESDAMAPFCDELVQLAEDFDFDGIQKYMIMLDS
jgi:CheY-like chemotaxis protein/HPt (histidine-containing phosphotransfer) domain-containing protein